VQFQDQSDNYPVSWSWDFGDGTTSSMQHPWHAYPIVGTYIVTLTATYCDGFTDVSTINFHVGPVGLEELPAAHLLTIAPNPFGESFTIRPGTAIGNVGLRILDMSGREVYAQQIEQVAAEGMTIDPAALSNGQYMLEARYLLNGAMAMERHKIQVQR
jgi:hypothetical protein